jgi:glycosyltransferase 2 family protein
MIRSSLESETYILQGTATAYQSLECNKTFCNASLQYPRRELVVNARWRKRALILALAAATLLIISFFRLRGTTFQWGLFLATFSRIDWLWLTISILLILLTYPGRALRWEVMIRPLGPRLSIRKLTYDTAIGFTAIVLLGRAGELVRPYLIALRAGLPFSTQMAAWLLERIFDLLVVLLLFGFGLTRIPSHGLALGTGLQWILNVGGYLALSIGAACILLLVVFRNFGDAGQKRILAALSFLPEKTYQRTERTLSAFVRGMQSTRDLRLLGLMIVYTILEWITIVGSYWALFRSFPATSQFLFTDVVVFLGFVAFGSVVQIPGIGGGIQVASIVVLTQIYGVAVEAATGVALFIWIVTFVVVVPVGLACAFHEGIHWSKLRHLPEDATL